MPRQSTLVSVEVMYANRNVTAERTLKGNIDNGRAAGRQIRGRIVHGHDISGNEVVSRSAGNAAGDGGEGRSRFQATGSRVSNVLETDLVRRSPNPSSSQSYSH